MKSHPVWTPLLGGLLGGVLCWLWPQSYQARTTLLFPAVQPELYQKLNASLRADPVREQLAGVSTPDISRAAMMILSSAAAREAASQGLSSSWARRGLEIEVQLTDSNTLQVVVEARRAVDAQSATQALLGYYQDFVKKTPLSRTRVVRESVEGRLTACRKELVSLEEKLSRSRSQELRRLGDATIKAGGRVMRDVWLKRLEEGQQSRILLRQLQTLRGQSNSTDRDEAWLADWGIARKLKPLAPDDLLNPPVRPQDVLQQAQLERTYYEALLQHRSLVLQHSFLLTWEALEKPDYETLDPTRIQSHKPDAVKTSLVGAFLGLLLALFSRRRTRARQG